MYFHNTNILASITKKEIVLLAQELVNIFLINKKVKLAFKTDTYFMFTYVI